MKQLLLQKTGGNPATRINRTKIFSRLAIFLLFAGLSFKASAGHYLAPDAPPTCIAGFTDSTADLTAYFTSTSTDTDANTEYIWHFGDGGISHQKNPLHHFKLSGPYKVCLTIINAGLSCNDSVCHTVTVTQCVASFDTSVVNSTLTAASLSTIADPTNTFYHWSFGDGGVGRDSSEVHVYKSVSSVCYVPVVLSNNQSVATGTNFTQMLTVNSATYAANETSGLDNVEFTTGPAGSGTMLQAWIESGNSSSSTSTVYWINLGSTQISANGSITIYMNFMQSGVMSATGPTGEAPQLSGTYAQNDNGALVFTNFYDNFAGTSLASQWSNTAATSVVVNNGLTLGFLGNNWYGIYTNTFSSALNTVAESYCSTSDVNGDGLCINTSGTSGNGINDGTDGVDAQLDDQYGFGGYGSCTSAPGTNAELANASPSPNTYYIMSFYMLSTPVLELNYGADENLTDNGDSGPTGDVSATSEVGLGVSGGGVTGSYQWFRDRVYEPNGVMPSAQFNALTCQTSSNVYDVCLTVTNPLTGCNNTSCENVTAPIAFISSCTAAFTDSVSGLAGYFTNTSSGVNNNTLYAWHFGDGDVSHLQNPSHVYNSTGTYTVCLTIANSATGCFDSVCHSITVTHCQAAFDTSTAGLALTVTSMSTGVNVNTIYHWDFGDGGQGRDSTQTHVYKTPGTYTVCLIISNTATGCTSVSCENVTVARLVSTCEAAYKDSVSDLAVYFTSTSTGVNGNTEYGWSFGDGDISHLTNPLHVYAAAGTYTVCLTIANSATGCFDSVCHFVTVTGCQAAIDTSTSGLVLTATSVSTGVDANTRYQWGFGDGALGRDSVDTHTYKAAGTYYVCLTISNTITGCISTTCDSVKVSVAVSDCQADFTSSQSNSDLRVTFTNTSTGTNSGTLYKWSFGDDTISHLQSPSHNYRAPGKYAVCLTISGTSGGFCSSTFCDTITVTTPVSECTADFTWDNFKGRGKTFTSTSQDTTVNTKYTWSFGDGVVVRNKTNTTHIYEQSGTYTVCLTITDSTETYCNSSICKSVDFVTGIDQLSFPGSSLYYDATASQLVVSWSGTDNVAISLVNMLGQDLQPIYTGNIHTGLYHFNVNTTDLAAGIYFIHITAQDGNRALKIFILPH